MKLIEKSSTVDCETSTIIDMSKFPSVFKKSSNGKLYNVGNSTVTPSVKSIGWTPEEMQKRRLLAFVKGIHVYGAGVSSGLVNTVNEFCINVDTFDYDNLTFALQRVSPKGLVKVGLDHDMVEAENRVKISYAVEKPGQYIMDIKYLDHPVPMSPFKIEVRDAEAINVKDVVAYGKGLKRCSTGDVTTFQVETKKVSGRITVAVDGQVDMPVSISECKTGYKIKYIATSTGNFFLRVKLNGKHIPGSPFMVKAEKKPEIPESVKYLFKRRMIKSSAEKATQLQP